MKVPFFVTAALMLTVLPAAADAMHGSTMTSGMAVASAKSSSTTGGSLSGASMSGGSMSGGTMSGGMMTGGDMKTNSSSHMTPTMPCKQSEHQADAMMSHTADQMKKRAGMPYMAMARADMVKGNEAGCRKETQSAMNALK